MQVQTTLARAPWPWCGPYPQPVKPPTRSILTAAQYSDLTVIERDLKIESALDGKTATSFELSELTGMCGPTIRAKLRKWVSQGKVILVNRNCRIDKKNAPFLYTLATGRNQ